MRLLLGDDGIDFAAGEPALANQDLAQTTRILCLMLQPTGEPYWVQGNRELPQWHRTKVDGDVAREVLDLNSLSSHDAL